MKPIQISMHQWAVILAAFLVFVVVLTGKVRYTEGDPRYELLVSQSILQNGTIRLDSYHQDLDLIKLNNNHGWMIHHWEDTDHDYYFYPIGTSVYSLPFVWVARRFGMDMLYLDHDTTLQIFIAAVVLSLIFLQLYRMARLVLDEWPALLFAMVMVFGSSLMSTGGVALWSHNFETLFMLSALLEVFAHARGARAHLRPAWLGFLLFSAYLCRPTAMIFVVLVLAYVGWKHRAYLPKLLAWLGGFMAVFIGWSFLEFGRPLPVYYDPSTWPSNEDFIGNFFAILLSPGRGLWIYMPLVLLGTAGWLVKGLRFQPLWLLAWAWWLLHTVMIARSAMPWGGWCYGSRFYIDLVPGFAVMLLMLVPHLDALPEKAAALLPKLFVALGAFGVYVHTVQGLYEPATRGWNDQPNIDRRWADERWDWRYPQFLASPQNNARRGQEMTLLPVVGRLAARLPKGSTLLYGQPNVDLRNTFVHWNRIEKLRGREVYNSLSAIEREEKMEFWITLDQLQKAKQWTTWSLDTSAAMPNLGSFLAASEAHSVIISLKDEGSYKLDKSSRAYLRQRGSMIDSLKFRQSYLAVLENGKLVHEAMGTNQVEYTWQGKPEVKVVSGGMDASNMSSIKLGGTEHSMNMRGMNVVVLSKHSRELVWSTNFDTHSKDAERQMLFKATRKLGY